MTSVVAVVYEYLSRIQFGNKSPPWKQIRQPECLYMQIPKGSIEGGGITSSKKMDMSKARTSGGHILESEHHLFYHPRVLYGQGDAEIPTGMLIQD
jgi:hypothetical protein